ncbi:MAG: flagellar protein FlaG [Lachnospiraceae bacterium]|nr:flagellar protein FlaG [Lachnospiraceae bacterium]MBO4824268.1 flagellar protein FlaG [Lachnospiraceae bacterium]MCR4679484.1 flagellar protein FlaG [Lachnospiraceae bacterium]
MALEPINTMMTVQAQTIQPKPVSTKPSVEYTDVSLTADTPKVDNTTRVVENTNEKSDSRSKDKEPSNETLHKAIEKINKQMTNSEAIYGFHDKTNRVTIKIIDKETKEVIKELPPEKTLDLIAKAWELAGILVDEKR